MKKQTKQIITIIVGLAAIIAAGCRTQNAQKTASNMQAKLGPPITVFSAPVASKGKQGTCPGSYAGYVIYTQSGTNWGWAPTTNNIVLTAADGGGRTDTKIAFNGEYGDSGCAPTNVTIPHPPMSPLYRFGIYFPSNVPTTNYPIILTGFNP